MHSNRHTRNAQQLRSLIQNMGRSIDEARTRRLGPSTPQAPLNPARAIEPMARPGVPAPQQPVPPSASAAHAPGAAPPIRGANEMFTDGTPRLKARPKRPS